MFNKAKYMEVFEIEDVTIDFGFINQFILDMPEEIELIRMVNENPIPEIEDAHVVRFVPTNEVNNNYREEAERV
jgi:hypothetical protein